MEIFDRFMKKAKPIDISLVKLSALFFGIFLAALFPVLSEINSLVWLSIGILIAIKPLMIILKK